MKLAATSLMYGIFACATVYADDTANMSLFFTADETRRIEMLATQAASSTQAIQDIHLGAVMFYGPNDWSIWLQNKRWSPQTASDDFQITNVEPDLVHIRLLDATGASERDIALKPYQTWLAASGKIIEGNP